MKLQPFKLALAIIAGGMMAMQAKASLIAYEGFVGLSNGNLNGQGSGTGWSGNWNNGGVGGAISMQAVASPGLTYTKSGALLGSAGGLARDPNTVTTNNYSFRSLSSAVGGVSGGTDIWASFLIQNGSLPLNSGQFFGFSLDSGSSEKVYTGYGNGDTDWLSVLEGSTNTVVRTFDNVDANTTHLIVLDLTFNSSVLTTEHLYVDPIPGLATPTGSAATATGTNASTFTINGIRIGGDWQMAVDEIRIGTTFADVAPQVPEPASLAMLGAGSLMMLRRAGMKQNI